jgi:hypothetical protein
LFLIKASLNIRRSEENKLYLTPIISLTLLI